MALSKEQVAQRVQEAVQTGNFFFPEDVVRGIAEHFGVDLQNSPLGQRPAAESRTRGEVHPDADETREFLRNRELKQTNKEGAPKAKQPKLETEVKEAGPIYPDGPEKDAEEAQQKEAKAAMKADKSSK